MLCIAALGVLAGMIRAAVLHGQGLERSLASLSITLPVMLAPVGVLAAYAVWLQRRNWVAAIWGGLAAAGGAAIYGFMLLHPEMNRDANIGMGLYWMFGWFYPLGLVFALGAALGTGVEKRRKTPSETAQLLSVPLKPWLWPLLVPALVSLTITLQPLLRLWSAGDDAQVRFGILMALFLSSSVTGLGQIAVSLSPALMVLVLLQTRTIRDGNFQPRLAAFWGLCLGLGMSLGLSAFGPQFLQHINPAALLLPCAALPIIGYAAGRWWGMRRKS